ncbi:hypothetical protein [Providencia phage PSTCR6]|nr:hypothetical protein [Providencia phage PSTCR6]
MKNLSMVVLALFLSGCMSQAEYEAWKERNRANSMSQSSGLSVTGAGLTFSNGSAGGMNNYIFNKPIDKKKLDAEVAARRAEAQRIADEAGKRLEQSEKDKNIPLKDRLTEQFKKEKLNCYQRAIITYRVMQQNAILTGDYSLVAKYDVPTLKKICEKNK